MVPFPLWVQDTAELLPASVSVANKVYESPTHMVASGPASAKIAGGSVIITGCEFVLQPFWSVIKHECDPGDRFTAGLVVWLLGNHKNKYGWVPKFTLTVAVPSAKPLQVTSVCVIVATGFSQTSINDESTPSQLSGFAGSASIYILTLYIPGPLKVCDVKSIS